MLNPYNHPSVVTTINELPSHLPPEKIIDENQPIVPLGIILAEQHTEENPFYILLEDGSYILLEEVGV